MTRHPAKQTNARSLPPTRSTLTPRSTIRTITKNLPKEIQAKKAKMSSSSRIEYSEKYADDAYEYRYDLINPVVTMDLGENDGSYMSSLMTHDTTHTYVFYFLSFLDMSYYQKIWPKHYPKVGY
jgi:hypothetical protein